MAETAAPQVNVRWIANLVTDRLETMIENRVESRGGTDADKTAVLRLVAENLANRN